MRKYLVVGAALLVLASLAQAQDKAQDKAQFRGMDKAAFERRNAAAAYAGTLKFAVGRAALLCRTALGRDEQYMRAIADEWTQRNLRYAVAAERWSTLVVMAVDQASGREAALRARDQILDTVSREGVRAAEQMVGTELQVRKLKCESLAGTVSNGTLDITESAKLYPELQELVSMFEQPQPAPASN